MRSSNRERPETPVSKPKAPATTAPRAERAPVCQPGATLGQPGQAGRPRSLVRGAVAMVKTAFGPRSSKAGAGTTIETASASLRHQSRRAAAQQAPRCRGSFVTLATASAATTLLTAGPPRLQCITAPTPHAMVHHQPFSERDQQPWSPRPPTLGRFEKQLSAQ